jgi:hypothetical protein
VVHEWSAKSSRSYSGFVKVSSRTWARVAAGWRWWARRAASSQRDESMARVASGSASSASNGSAWGGLQSQVCPASARTNKALALVALAVDAVDEDHAGRVALEEVVDERDDNDDGGGRGREAETGEALDEGGDQRRGEVPARRVSQ